MRIRPRGIWTVANLELRQRVRSVRWYVAIGVWFVVLLGMSLLVVAVSTLYGDGTLRSLRIAGAIVFSTSVMLLVFANLLISPALASGAINGDRTAGTLATLQSTLLSPLEIVLGKILAGWLTGLAFLVAALPSILPSAVMAGVGPFYLLRVLVTIAMITLLITMIGVGLSSVAGRQLGSVVLTYLLVLGTTVILPMVYVVSLPLMFTEREVTTHTMDYETADGDGNYSGTGQCVERTEKRTVPRTDLLLPLVYVNPFVIVADQAPLLTEDWGSDSDQEVDALRLISYSVRWLAHPLHPSHFVSCTADAPGYPTDIKQPLMLPVWPWGAALYMLAGGGSVAVATWRVRTPMRHVGRGTRIA